MDKEWQAAAMKKTQELSSDRSEARVYTTKVCVLDVCEFIGHTQLILNEREKKLINIMGSWVPFLLNALLFILWTRRWLKPEAQDSHSAWN